MFSVKFALKFDGEKDLCKVEKKCRHKHFTFFQDLT